MTGNFLNYITVDEETIYPIQSRQKQQLRVLYLFSSFVLFFTQGEILI